MAVFLFLFKVANEGVVPRSCYDDRNRTAIVQRLFLSVKCCDGNGSRNRKNLLVYFVVKPVTSTVRERETVT